MQTLFTTIKYSNNTNSYLSYPSFKMKMSELKDVDKFVAKKYNINPQQCKTITEFQIKCKDFIEKAFAIDEKGNITKDFFGRREEAQIERKEMIKEWYDYVTKENDAYTSAIQLMILKSIIKDLKPNEDTLPPVLNKGVLARTVMNVQNRLRQDEKTNLNFDKEYRLNLQKSMLEEETALDESLNGWIVIPSKEHDPENFEANVDKLKMFSHND